jgi:lipopolysaccharide biosynthesis regulator YciM
MEMMEDGIIKQLESIGDTPGYVDLLVASQIIDSKVLYNKALNALFLCSLKPTLDQARRIGTDAYFAVMQDHLTRPRCRYAGKTCDHGSPTIYRQCAGCKQWQ